MAGEVNPFALLPLRRESRAPDRNNYVLAIYSRSQTYGNEKNRAARCKFASNLLRHATGLRKVVLPPPLSGEKTTTSVYVVMYSAFVPPEQHARLAPVQSHTFCTPRPLLLLCLPFIVQNMLHKILIPGLVSLKLPPHSSSSQSTYMQQQQFHPVSGFNPVMVGKNRPHFTCNYDGLAVQRARVLVGFTKSDKFA